MSILDKKSAQMLLDAGFSEEDLGLVHGGKRGIELYESPQDYFAKELIENACEQGECDLYDEILPEEKGEPYDCSHPGIYDDNEYPGNDDESIYVPGDLREQVSWIKTINIGKISLWQKRKDNFFSWPVKRIEVRIPEEEKSRMLRLSSEDRQYLWKTYAKESWKELWVSAIDTLHSRHCEKVNILSGSKSFNLIVIKADDMRELGHRVPGEAEWVTMMYFDKNDLRAQIKPMDIL